MLSRFHDSRLNKAVALLTSTLFILAMFPGCAESPKAPTKQTTSASVPQPLNQKGSPSLLEAELAGGLVQGTSTPDISVPRKRKDVQADVEEHSNPGAVPLSEAERTSLITEALSLPDGQSVQSTLYSMGYELRTDLAIGARKTMQPDSGAVTVIIPFGIPSDSTRGAFVNYSKIGADIGFGAFFMISQADSPTVDTYERMFPQLWLLVDSDDGPVFPPAIDEAGKNFGQCYGDCTLDNLGFCAGCALGILPPVIFACMGGCLTGVGYGCLVQCVRQVVKKKP